MSDLGDDELLEALGVEIKPIKGGAVDPRAERLIVGFQDILRFYEANGRAPEASEGRGIFERLYAIRLDRLRRSPEARTLLSEFDKPGLLASASPSQAIADLDEDALLAELGVSGEPADNAENITVLRNVRSRTEKRSVEEMAGRTACADFTQFRSLFQMAENDLKSGCRKAVRFTRETSIAPGDFFILGGQLAYVAAMDKQFRTPNGRINARLRIIFSNATESNLLLLSFERALYKDDTGRRITESESGSLFGDEVTPDDIEVGTIYVLRSLSDHPFVAANRDVLHKIGVTGGKIEARIANAENDATFLLAKVSIVATYKLHNLSRTKLENVFHRLFGAVQLNITIKDRFGRPVKPREWFLVPLQVIDQAVRSIRDGSIANLVYDPKTARLTRAI